LETQGHEVNIINFVPWYHRDRYNWFAIQRDKNCPIKGAEKVYRLLQYLHAPFTHRDMLRTWGRKKEFDKFTKNFLHLTPTKYFKYEDLRKNPPLADIYIAGSDQIWNTKMKNGKDSAFYLKFGSHSTKRIAYAASLGASEIEPGWDGFVKEGVSGLNYVSVREETGKQLLCNLGLKNIECVVDPVFLLEKTQWKELFSQAKKYHLEENKYILLYDFLGNDDRMQAFTLEYARKHHLKIVSVNDFDYSKYADIQINDAGPLEFLSLIEHASCIVSSSFHATAFSILLEKEFYTFDLKGHGNSSRMMDLLNLVHLQDRFNPSHKTSSAVPIDYQQAKKALSFSINASKTFLANAINA
jgi:hypothetical protein